MQSFNLTQCNQLSIPDAKEYIKKYFFPLSDGQHVELDYEDDGKLKYLIKDDKTIKSVYFNRLPKAIHDFYFKEYDQIKTLTCQLNKPFLFGKYINTCPAFIHDIVPYDSYPNEMKKKVQAVLDLVLEIWTSNNEPQFNFIMKWLANMARGGKNQSVLYLRGEQGIGKSTFTDFLRKFVIGPQLCIQSGSQPLISNFNYTLFSRLLVIFEELENFSTSQWQGVSTRLKRDTTSDTCTYEEKYQKPFIAKNITNYIINSNVDAIKDDDGRRYFILDLSSKLKGNFDYFEKWRDLCFNEEVGKAFFSYLHTIDLTGFRDQDFPETRAKEDAIVKRLDNVARFLKDKYILKFKDLNTSLKELYDEYVGYCSLDGCKSLCKVDFNRRLESYAITSYKSNNTHNKFNYKHKVIDDIARKNKWIHSTDQYDDERDDVPASAQMKINPLDKFIIGDDERDDVPASAQMKINPLDKFIIGEEVGAIFTDNNLDNGLIKDLEEKEAEIKSLKEQLERLKNKDLLDKNIVVEAIDDNDELVRLKRENDILRSRTATDLFGEEIKAQQDEFNALVGLIKKPEKKKKDKKQQQKDLDDIFSLAFN